MNEAKFTATFTALKRKIADFLTDPLRNNNSSLRRRLYSEADLLRLEIEEITEVPSLRPSWLSSSYAEELEQQLSSMMKALPLLPVKRSMQDSLLFYNPLAVFVETYARMSGVACSIFFAGAFMSLPILLLRAIDIQLRRDPYHYFSDYLKKVRYSSLYM
jgi:hypothetical protein